MKNRNMLQKWLIILFLGLIIQAVSAQNINVHGIITDETGETMIGVSVLVKGTSTGVVTDVNGNFSLSVPKNSVLSISYIGYKSQEISINGAKKLNIEMEPEAQNLDEVVVVAYGQQKKVSVTGSMSSINNEALLKSPSASLGNAISGKLPGLSTVQYSGLPGADDPVILIRGQSSFNGSSPLILVDGVERSFTQIDPNEVADITVLKDASATAVYGVRGANGVIIITTKKAKEGQTRVNINGSFGFKAITNKIAMVDADGFKLLYNEQLRNEGNPEYDFSDWTGNTNWQDEIFQTGFITNNNISITGASDKHSFYLGAGYAYEQGNIKYEKYSKITLNISNDYKVTDNFKVGFQFNGARMLPADSKSVATALRAAPVAEVYNKEYGLYTSLPGFQKAQMNNPMVDVDLKANTTKAENYRGSGNIYGPVSYTHLTLPTIA